MEKLNIVVESYENFNVDMLNEDYYGYDEEEFEDDDETEDEFDRTVKEILHGKNKTVSKKEMMATPASIDSYEDEMEYAEDEDYEEE